MRLCLRIHRALVVADAYDGIGARVIWVAPQRLLIVVAWVDPGIVNLLNAPPHQIQFFNGLDLPGGRRSLHDLRQVGIVGVFDGPIDDQLVSGSRQ